MRMLTVKQPWRAVQAVAATQVEPLRRILLRLWDTPMPGLEAALAEGRPGPALQVVEQALYPAEQAATVKTKNVFLRCIGDAGEATWQTGMRPISYTPKIRTAEAGAKEIPGTLTLSFDRTDPHALVWANQNAAKLVTACNNRDAVRKVIVGGFADQKSPRVIAKQVEQTIGLSDPQFNKWKSIIDDKARAKYARKAVKDRALLIARTETMRASNAGQFEGWRQGVKAGQLTGQENRVWITAIDDRTCPVCAPMDGAIIPMKGSFFLPPAGNKFVGGEVRMPPAHPACRCAMGLTEKAVTQGQAITQRPDEDWEYVAPKIQTQLPRSITHPKKPAAQVKPKKVPTTGVVKAEDGIKAYNERGFMQVPSLTPGSEIVAKQGKTVADVIAREAANIRKVTADKDIMALLEHTKQKFVLLDGPVVDHKSMSMFRGVQPRGWPPGKSWDTVCGVYDGTGKWVMSGVGEGASNGSVLAHEAGHAVDHAMRTSGFGGSKTWLKDELSETWNKHILPNQRNYHYFRQTSTDGMGLSAGLSETWAESVSVRMHEGPIGVERLFGKTWSTQFEKSYAKAQLRGRKLAERAAKAAAKAAVA
jgi:hypothetical protein